MPWAQVDTLVKKRQKSLINRWLKVKESRAIIKSATAESLAAIPKQRRECEMKNEWDEEISIFSRELYYSRHGH